MFLLAFMTPNDTDDWGGSLQKSKDGGVGDGGVQRNREMTNVKVRCENG